MIWTWKVCTFSCMIELGHIQSFTFMIWTWKFTFLSMLELKVSFLWVEHKSLYFWVLSTWKWIKTQPSTHHFTQWCIRGLNKIKYDNRNRVNHWVTQVNPWINLSCPVFQARFRLLRGWNGPRGQLRKYRSRC